MRPRLVPRMRELLTTMKATPRQPPVNMWQPHSLLQSSKKLPMWDRPITINLLQIELFLKWLNILLIIIFDSVTANLR